MSPKSDGFMDFVLDQLSGLPGIAARSMFGGYGLYHRATFFGIIHKGRLYFKVTRETASRYQDQGMKPFRPNAKQILKSLYEVPIDVLEDAEQLVAWGQESAKQ
jgi:DNA transformation protein and related proteins